MEEIILYFGIIAWERIRQRPQEIAWELSLKGKKVIYVNPPYSFIDFLINKFRKTDKKIDLRLKPKIKKISENLVIYYPPLLFPFPKIRLFAWLNFSIISWSLKRLFRHFISKIKILWLSFPNQKYLISKIKYKMLVYDIMDDYLALQHSNFIKKQLKSLHEFIIKKADYIIITSKELKKSNPLLKIKENVHLVPNAVSSRFLEKKNYPTPLELKNIKKPILGFVGYIGKWIDLDILTRFAQENPHISLVLIGPIFRDISRFKLKNIYFLGPKRHEHLPQYISHFDICLIPFIVNEITNKVNPVKLFEYLALEKPVIASETKELKKYKNYCHLYKNYDEFKKIINTLLIKNKIDKHKYKNLVIQNTWEKRAQKIIMFLKTNKKSQSIFCNSK